MKMSKHKLTELVREELMNEASRKWAVRVRDIGTVLVNAGGAAEAKRMVAKKLRGGLKDIESVNRAFPAKKVSDMDEE